MILPPRLGPAGRLAIAVVAVLLYVVFSGNAVPFSQNLTAGASTTTDGDHLVTLVGGDGSGEVARALVRTDVLESSPPEEYNLDVSLVFHEERALRLTRRVSDQPEQMVSLAAGP